MSRIIFDKYVQAYKDAYRKAHDKDVDITYENGWVILTNGSGSRVRSKQLPFMIENLNKMAENKKNKKPEDPTYNIKTKIKFVKKVNDTNEFYKDFCKVFIGELFIAYYFRNKLNYETERFVIMPVVPVDNYKKDHPTEEEVKEECTKIAKSIIDKINNI